MSERQREEKQQDEHSDEIRHEGSICGDTLYYLQCRVHLSLSPAPRASGSQCPCSETQRAERTRVRKQHEPSAVTC